MSLQRRLVAAMAILLVVGLVVADVVTYVSVRSFLYGRADATLASSETLAFNYAVYSAERHAALGQADLSRHVSPDVYVVITDPKGKMRGQPPLGVAGPARSGADPDRIDPRPAGAQRDRALLRPLRRHVPPQSRRRGGGEHAAIRTASTGRWRSTVPQGTMYLALSLNPTNDTLASLRRIELLASLAVVVIMGVLALWIVRRDLRPLRQMAETADAIASGDLGRRVPQEAADHRGGPARHRPQRDAHPD